MTPAPKSDGELGGAWELSKTTLSSPVQSSDLGTRLTAEAPEIRWVQIHPTCTSSAYSGYVSRKCKSNNQPNCYTFPLHATAYWCSSSCHALLAQARPRMQRILLVIIGASLSKPHINVLNTSGVCMYVCMYVFVRRTINTFIFVE